MQTVMSEELGMLARFFPAGAEDRPGSFESAEESKAPRHKVVILESNAPLARLIATGLIPEKVSVRVTDTMDRALSQLGTSAFDTLILDIDLPDMDGLKALADLRAARPSIRILATSHRQGTESLVAALDSGADDYLPKPFSLLEMMARVRALHRRSALASDPAVEARPAGLVLNREQCQAQRDGRVIDLTPREFTLLEYLMKNPGKTLSRALLTQEVWNMSAETNTNIVDVYIKYLRDKIDGDHSVKLIRTVRGMGYLFQAQA